MYVDSSRHCLVGRREDVGSFGVRGSLDMATILGGLQ